MWFVCKKIALGPFPGQGCVMFPKFEKCVPAPGDLVVKCRRGVLYVLYGVS